ncbi:MAG: 1-acyl-sn-glycerol-3-phosphate acyltransferase [Clostridia bacterium]|nr:1-acyl-sn-glycerol-3-phosphate acyltransferase [Clostridia bacterium]
MSFYRVARFATGLYLKVFYRVKYVGRENVPDTGAAIIMSNHSSFADALFTANAVKRDITFIARSSLTKNKVVDFIFRLCHVITVNRGESDMQAMRKSCAVLAEEKCFGIYPQGTRLPGPPLPDQAMAGIGLIASRSKAPVVPVAICPGNNKKRKPCLFRKVTVVVGKPVPCEEYTGFSDRPNSREIASYTFSKVCDLYNEYNR